MRHQNTLIFFLFWILQIDQKTLNMFITFLLGTYRTCWINGASWPSRKRLNATQNNILFILINLYNFRWSQWRRWRGKFKFGYFHFYFVYLSGYAEITNEKEFGESARVYQKILPSVFLQSIFSWPSFRADTSVLFFS